MHKRPQRPERPAPNVRRIRPSRKTLGREKATPKVGRAPEAMTKTPSAIRAVRSRPDLGCSAVAKARWPHEADAQRRSAKPCLAHPGSPSTQGPSTNRSLAASTRQHSKRRVRFFRRTCRRGSALMSKNTGERGRSCSNPCVGEDGTVAVAPETKMTKSKGCDIYV